MHALAPSASATHARGAAASWSLALVAAVLGGCARDPRPATWEYISPAITAPNCATASCHGEAAAVAGLDFSTSDHGYKSLTRLWVWIVDPKATAADRCKRVHGVTVCERLERPLVTPYDPDQSRLVHLLRADGAPRMPPDRPLPEADIQLIERWILDGARKSARTDAASSNFEDAPASPAGDAAGDAAGDVAAVDGAGSAG